MAQYPELRDRTVLITGGALGIGASMVRAFAAQGARVFFCDVDSSHGRELAQEVGENVHFDAVDLMQEKQVVRWIHAIRRRGFRIDILINNAASDPRIPIAELTASAWDALFARNLRAYFLTVREALPSMGAGGAIINFASLTFHTAPPNMSAYVATKAGILGFSRSLARELGPRRIRVNVISPGWVMTERQLREHVTPAVKKLIKQSQAISDLIQPEEIAEIALFLASDASAVITGQEILADRGWAHS